MINRQKQEWIDKYLLERYHMQGPPEKWNAVSHIAQFYCEASDMPTNESISGLIESSKHSQVHWHQLAAIAHQCEKQGKILPSDLMHWLVEVANGRIVRPHSDGTLVKWRNRILFNAINDLSYDFNLRPTNNSLSESISACSILVEKTGLSQKLLESIWAQRDPEFLIY